MYTFEKKELGLKDLRSMFDVDEAAWLLYRRKNGSIGIQPGTKQGEKNVEQAVKAGGMRLCRLTGMSAKEALRAAKSV